MGLELVPPVCREKIEAIRSRVRKITQMYGSLSNYGRPIYEDIMDVACVIYANEALGVSLDVLAKEVGLDKTTFYKTRKKIETEGKVTILENGKLKTVEITIQDCVRMVEEGLKARSRARIGSPLESAIVKEFATNDVRKRAVITGKPSTYSEKQKMAVVKLVERIMRFIEENNMDVPLNPDLWTEEQVEKVLYSMAKGEVSKVRRWMKLLRRVPAWSSWFKGRIGREVKYARFRYVYLSYGDYLKLKRAWKDGKLTDAEFLLVWLHLTTGAREGWGVEGVKDSTPLSDATSSLVGLRWEKITRLDGVYYIEIWESKTSKPWVCDLTWLDPEVVDILLKYRKKEGSIVETLTGLKTVGQFRAWYSKLMEKISLITGKVEELDGKPTPQLVPHDLRRSHLAILAELGVPLEISCSGQLGFGVGWEDLSTAYYFYLRLSKHVKEKIMTEVRERQASFS